jgi:hypothetical protein
MSMRAKKIERHKSRYRYVWGSHKVLATENMFLE